ncbi:MAG: Gfo/Idh/MocA family oxidoreductase [Proteobacteria bacterium]|nr:Gfo/Idh/MocA family oxidoreductase [Pseudomonadota bacterium]
MSVKYNYTSLKIAVIGCGNWGKNLCRVLHELGVLSVICDAAPTQAMQASERFKVPATTLENLLQDKSINGVFIATPSPTHFEIAMACLKANKHTFIEKPLTLNYEQATILTQTAALNGLKLMVGHLLQYHSAFNHIKKLKKEGVLGDLKYIYANRVNFGKFASEKSVLWDYAPHDISMILSLTQALPLRVMALSANHFQHTIADSTHIHLDFQQNIKAHVFVSWHYPFKEQKMIVVGSKAIAVFEDSQPWEQKLRLSYYPEEWSDGLPHPFKTNFEYIPIANEEPLRNECSHFLQCILHNNQPNTNGQEALQVLKVLEATALSIAKGTPVPLLDFENKPKFSQLTNLEKVDDLVGLETF